MYQFWEERNFNCWENKNISFILDEMQIIFKNEFWQRFVSLLLSQYLWYTSA